MSRIAATIEQARQSGGKLLIPYLVAGDPDLATSAKLMHELVDCGADILELGIPFSDPSSDGPVIQRGVERALARGTTLRDVLALVQEFRQRDDHTPIVLMGYLNPIEIMGQEAFVAAAVDSGVDGVLIVDMPPAEAGELHRRLQAAQVDTIFLVAPTTTRDRVNDIVQHCSGYLYYVSLKGVTGAVLSDYDSVAENISNLRSLCDLPIVVGFGINDAASAQAMARAADGIVIGSALVGRIGTLDERAEPADLKHCTEVIRAARVAINDIK